MSETAEEEKKEPCQGLSSDCPTLSIAADTSAEDSQAPPKKVAKYLIVLSALCVLGMAALAVVFRNQLRNFDEYGYLGAFLISLMSGATFIVYVPGVPIIFALGGILPSPLLVGLAAGAGEGLGAFVFYLAGHSGHSLLTEKQKNNKIYSRVRGWMARRGSLTLFLASAIFNPVFALFGAAAGAINYPPWKFYLSCTAGKAVKGIYVAYLGALGLNYILHWLHISLET
jgi:uncharacterized membrane protein YdjX (TVP38/TMEM64 family)